MAAEPTAEPAAETATETTVRAPGLSAPVTIRVDRWGIAHIAAETPADAFFAQGWNAARDRLWQIDLWRKRGLGLLAGDFGPAYADKDRAARLFLYRGDMAAEWRSYGPNAKAWTQAFVAGINAYLDGIDAGEHELPPEFRVMGTKPGRWQAEDVVRIRSHARVHNLDHELRRSAVLARYGAEADGLRKARQPDRPLRVPEGFEPAELPAEILQTYLLATEPPTFGSDTVQAEAAPSELLGSNAWALSPARTTTGRPILASDPHRAHQMPGLRYIVHLQAPGLNVIGAGEPAVPGVSFGHNADIAFGLTIWPIDQEDLCVYELNPADPEQYRYGGGWEAMRVERQTLAVKGEGERAIELRFTRHGPVLHVDRAAGKAYGLRTVWTEPGTAAYLASLAFLQAKTVEDYEQALKGWGAPSSNHIVAETGGRIARFTAGFVPIRPNWDGLLPVPGDGRYEWAGLRDPLSTPRVKQPAEGWVATANQFNLPEAWLGPDNTPGFEWPDPARYRTIAAALEAKPRHSLDDMRALQTSYRSNPAERLVPLLADLPETPATAMLTGWDRRLDADSAAAALFETWFMRHLAPLVLAQASPQGLQAYAALPDLALAVDLVTAADPRLGDRAALLSETLAAAWEDALARFGAEPAAWRWGGFHHAYHPHDLSALLDEATRQAWSVGPLPKGGSGLTINNNNYRLTDGRMTLGVTWRMVCDVGNWDACVTINSPGQSGLPSSPHYQDLFPLWAREEYVAMAFGDAAVRAATEQTLRLSP
ncbi:MAG: penicillin acylase family protein [Alphaproteobacteria bacterium]|nr:penicillin acylase family protein [Alphaproteobacteria bacterium]MCB9930216.1 penicillin acylase family protein [Alphaproteobacteria bacterium]